MADIFPSPSYPLGAPGGATTLPGRSDAVERLLMVTASDQDPEAAMAVIGLDAIDPVVIEPALRDLLLRYARLLEAIAASNNLRERRADIRGYAAWALEHGLAPIPATGDGLCTQIESYLTALGAAHAPRTVSRTSSSLGQLARGLGLETLGAPERRRLAIRVGRRQARAARGFVQIGDENVHRVRGLMDEVFGEENFRARIS